MNNRELKQLLKPCSNKSYGAFYTLIILGIGVIVGGAWLFIQFCKALFKAGEMCYDYYLKLNNKKQIKKSIEKSSMSELELFGKFESCLMNDNNRLYYTLNGYTNKDGVLRQYIDFHVAREDGTFWNVNKVLGKYLIRSSYKVRYCKSGNNAGSVILSDIDQIELEQSIKDLYGVPVKLIETYKECV